MNKVEDILNHYPKIQELLNSNFTLVEICKIFKNKHISNINYGTLTSTLSNIKNGLIHPEYNMISPLLTSRDNYNIFIPYSVKFYGTWICFSTSSAKNEWKLTEKTLSKLPDPIGMLYMKRFLKLYHIPDNYLLQSFKNTYGRNLTDIEINKIKNISNDIKYEYDKIIADLKEKTLDYIFGEYTNG